MTNVPEGAQLSEDGQWWWDGDAQQWQPVQGGATSSEAPSASSSEASSASPSEASADAAEGGDGGGGDRAAARVALGMPAALEDLTDEHRAPYFAEPTVTVEAVEHEEVDALAMTDADGENVEEMA